jgi:hypothetical protein
MTRAEFAKGAATFLLVIVAGFLSETCLDRHFAATDVDRKAASSDRPEASASPACVDKDGAWKNWPWPNVPALGPKCTEER